MKPDRIAGAVAYLADKAFEPSVLQASLGLSDKSYAGVLVTLLNADNKLVKNRAAKLLTHLSEAAPGSIYPHRAKLLEALGSGQTILQWNSLITLGHLSTVAEDAWLKDILPVLLSFLRDESMITAGHAVACLGCIAATKESCRDRIVKELIDANSIPRDPEGAAILAGKILTALDPLAGRLGSSGQAALCAFGDRYLKSHRGSTRRAAAKLLRHFAGK